MVRQDSASERPANRYTYPRRERIRGMLESRDVLRLQCLREGVVNPASWHVKDTDNGSIRQRDSANLPRGGNAPFVSRLRDERDRGACASRCSRWPEAGAPARAVRDARTE